MVVTTTAAERLWRHVFRRLRELTSGADGGRPRRRRGVLFAAVCGRLVWSVGKGRSPCRRWENSRRRRRWPLTVSRRLPSAARLVDAARGGGVDIGGRLSPWLSPARSRSQEGVLTARRHAPLRPGGSPGGTMAAHPPARSSTAVRRPGAGGLSAGGRRWSQPRRDRRLRPVDEPVEKDPVTHVFPVRESVRSRGLSRGSPACSRQPGRHPWVRREKRVSPEGVAVGDVGVARWVRVVALGGI